MKNYLIISGWLITLFLLLTTTTGQAGPSSEQPPDVKTDSTLIELKPLGTDEAVDVTISFGIKPMMGMLYQKYERNDGTKISDNIPIFRGGVSLHYNRFFGDLYYQRSDKGYESQFIHQDTHTIGSYNTEQRKEFRRKDYAISAGYTLPSYFNILGGQFAIFGGYKVGQIDINRRDVLFDVPGEVLLDASGKVLVNASGAPRTTTLTQLHQDEISFQTKGPSLGAFYVLPIGDTANIRINGAWAWLTGTYTNHPSEYTSQAGNVTLADRNLTPSPTNGWTLGVEWTHYLSPHLKYSLGMDYFKYTMDMTEHVMVNGNPVIDSKNGKPLESSVSITEDLATLKAALVYEF
jgi:hypothetical protein